MRRREARLGSEVLRRGLRLALPLLAALLGSCHGSEGDACDTDEQCEEGLACFYGTCRQLSPPAGTVVFEVVPPALSGLTSATFPIPSGSRQPLHFEFCRPAAVEGNLVGGGLVLAEGTPAGLPGRRIGQQQTIPAALGDASDGPGDGPFRLQLPPGEWRLTFLPGATGSTTAEPLPPPIPVEIEGGLPRCEVKTLGPLRPDLDARRARLAVVIDPERDPRPRCGVLVTLHDPDDGRPLSQPLELRQEPGRACAPPAEGWTVPFREPAGDEIEVRIEPLGPIPTAVARSRRVALPPASAGDTVDLGTFGVGDAAPERVEIVLASDGTAIEGAQIQATREPEAKDERPIATPLARPVADAPGHYELWLLPGSWTLRIEPPVDSDLSLGRCIRLGPAAPCAERIRVEAGSPLQVEATLEPKVRIRGRVLDPDLVGLKRARVVAVPRGDAREHDTLTGSDGRFELRVDAGGVYDLLVQPRERAWSWQRARVYAPVAGDLSLDPIVLPEPARVVGRTTLDRRGTSVALPGARIRAWRTDLAEGLLLVGEAFSDEEGRFGLSLPPGP